MGRKQIPYHISGEEYLSSKFSNEEILKIKGEYPYLYNKELSDKYNISSSTLVSLARHYSLKKDTSLVGRELTLDTLKEIALKFNTKKEFSHKDPSAYATANKMGIIEEVTSHMVNISFSVPQIILRQITEKIFDQECEYNTRKVIKPYEIDVYYPKLKLGFEYDGKGWHEGDESDKESMCEKKGIKLITLRERSRNYLEDIQTYLIENLEDINTHTKKGITISDILSFNDPIDFPKLFTDEELKILRENEVSYLRKHHDNLYQKYKKYNPDNLDFNKFKYTEESIIEEIKKYNSEGELLKNNSRVYHVIHKRFRHLLPIYGKGKKTPIVCVDTGQEFKSISEASRVLKICKSSIDKVVNGQREKAGGKKFKKLNI